jgi:hypothetical protein
MQVHTSSQSARGFLSKEIRIGSAVGFSSRGYISINGLACRANQGRPKKRTGLYSSQVKYWLPKIIE